ncbi:chemokine (C-C motif) ligand 34a, duplicate 3 isoform X3 [Carassius carassius]|uniref:chemokine (C-C motif) ligand 34a, duplicate 3 isoform X3 n=1 Tax=Carassius carassius TaxID=217509 RepID=UPI0028696C08|nr:chemokine (C-C motif) ligand 34a, duplicate 3 isoform X3 [Carassius carassius]
MQFNQIMTMSLAAIAVIMSVMLSGTNGQNRPIECCTSVSTKEITLPITGFRLQQRNLPCVRAVVHWKQGWVRQKIREFSELHRRKTNSTVSTPLSTSSP